MKAYLDLVRQTLEQGSTPQRATVQGQPLTTRVLPGGFFQPALSWTWRFKAKRPMTMISNYGEAASRDPLNKPPVTRGQRRPNRRKLWVGRPSAGMVAERLARKALGRINGTWAMTRFPIPYHLIGRRGKPGLSTRSEGAQGGHEPASTCGSWGKNPRAPAESGHLEQLRTSPPIHPLTEPHPERNFHVC